MPHNRTESQAASSRSNGGKSSGPTSPQGKSSSSKNSRKHGLYTAKMLVEGEHPEQFLALHKGFADSFQPRDPYEDAAVARIAACHWRLDRAMRVEAEFWNSFAYQGRSKASAYDFRGTQPEQIARQVAAAERSLDRAHKCLDNYRKMPKLDEQIFRETNPGFDPADCAADSPPDLVPDQPDLLDVLNRRFELINKKYEEAEDYVKAKLRLDRDVQTWPYDADNPAPQGPLDPLDPMHLIPSPMPTGPWPPKKETNPAPQQPEPAAESLHTEPTHQNAGTNPAPAYAAPDPQPPIPRRHPAQRAITPDDARDIARFRHY